MVDLSLLTSQWQKISFIAALCQRHQGNHSLFCESQDLTDSKQIYEKTLNKCWEFLAGQLTSTKNLEKALLQFESIQPDPEQYDSYGVYPATDAHILLTSALQMIFDESADDCEMASNLSIQTVNSFIHFTNDNDCTEIFENHPLIKDEIQFQLDALTLITENGSHAEVIKKTRRWLRTFETTNLGIENI